jgi:FKBP-type peptidyl-prolyl cis-trans isomerase
VEKVKNMRTLSKGESIGVSIAVVAVIAGFFFWNVLANISSQNSDTSAVQSQLDQMAQQATSSNATINNPVSTNPTSMNPSNQHTLADGLIIQDDTVGTGAVATAGQSVTVNYLGTFESTGKKFDSSYDRNQPFTFVLGAGQVIKGWDEGVAGMKVGGKRTLTVPPSLGYGPNDYGPIPGNSTLVFQVELLGVK